MQNVGFGFMHCLDEIGDLEDYERNGILRYLLDLKAQEWDYSVIATLTPKDTKGTCVYCKHCHPCPAGLDIGLINKYYDLSRLGDVLAKERYGCGSAACRYTSARAVCTVFTIICGEFAASQWADVGIGPYIKTGRCIRMRPSFSQNRCILRADRVVRPYEGCAYRNFTICTSSRYVPSLRQNAFGMQPISVKPSFR